MDRKMAYEVERLLHYGFHKGLIKKEDVIPTRNALLDILQLNEPSREIKWYEFHEVAEDPSEILTPILDGCYARGVLPENTTAYRDLMDARIMGALMPRASEVVDEFYLRYEISKEDATDYFYKLSQDSHYIQMDRIKKNWYWTTETEFGDLEITVNLSKPEKDVRDIERAKLLPPTNYPSCVLCAENEGFAGNLNQAARQNLRLIPLTLNKESWYLQYSPYVYYNEHCIVLLGEHTPMKVCEKTIRRLLDFVTIMPHYFLGSNAGLPIVGGSILAHDHYQGGRHKFAMEKAQVLYSLDCDGSAYGDKDLQVAVLKWPLSVVRIASKNKEAVYNCAIDLMNKWEGYSDETVGIYAFTGETLHNAVTPIARINKDGQFEMDIVLRNNLTSEEHPLGIFHPHEQWHHIKKENIGLIEVMGLAVLPGRLEKELGDIQDILTGKVPFLKEKIDTETNSLQKHLPWIEKLVTIEGTEFTEKEAEALLQKEVGSIFLEVLKDAGVFKTNEEGQDAFKRFLKMNGFEQK